MKYPRPFRVYAQLVLLTCLVILPISSLAFDGERNGLILGGHASYAPWTEWRGYDLGVGVRSSAFGGGLVAGYTFGNKHMFALESTILMVGDDEDEYAANPVLRMVKYTHFLNSEAPSLLASIGIGQLYSASSSEGVKGYGLGLLASVGYEFRPHVLIGLSALYGETDGDYMY